ncbi:hypothetical protein VTO42DRAFT_7081 [Malbranchea cinnamomea]
MPRPTRSPLPSDPTTNALQALKNAASARREAIQAKNFVAEQVADSSIAALFHTLSSHATYPLSFSRADRARTTQLFAKLRVQYPQSSRQDKDVVLQTFEERIFHCTDPHQALAGLATLAVTGVVVGDVVVTATNLLLERYYSTFADIHPNPSPAEHEKVLANCSGSRWRGQPVTKNTSLDADANSRRFFKCVIKLFRGC